MLWEGIESGLGDLEQQLPHLPNSPLHSSVFLLLEPSLAVHSQP